MSTVGFGGTSLGRKTSSYMTNVGPHPAMSASLSFPCNYAGKWFTQFTDDVVVKEWSHVFWKWFFSRNWTD